VSAPLVLEGWGAENEMGRANPSHMKVGHSEGINVGRRGGSCFASFSAFIHGLTWTLEDRGETWQWGVNIRKK
jgi:hypothetical protein